MGTRDSGSMALEPLHDVVADRRAGRPRSRMTASELLLAGDTDALKRLVCGEGDLVPVRLEQHVEPATQVGVVVTDQYPAWGCHVVAPLIQQPRQGPCRTSSTTAAAHASRSSDSASQSRGRNSMAPADTTTDSRASSSFRN